VKLFDLATWVSAVILVVGSLVIFLWFLKDAGKVLRGEGTRDPGGGEVGSETPDSRS
jgi:hypothetical protein